MGLDQSVFARLITAAVIALPATGIAAETYAPPTIDDVVAGLQKIEKALFETQSFMIQYERDSVVNMLESSPTGLLTAKWTQAFLHDKWYSERTFTRPTSGPPAKGKLRVEIPAKPTVQVLKLGFVLQWDQSPQSVVIRQFNENSNLYSGLNYTRNLSLDAPKYIARAGNVDLATMRRVNKDNADLPFLPEFLIANISKYRMSAAPQTINGVTCWVIEWPGMDAIAVDPDRGYAIIHRSYCWAPGKQRRVEVTNSAHQQVKPGLWLPFQQEEIRFASIVQDSEAAWGKPVSRSHYQVHRLQFDELNDTFFSVKLPQKTRVFDATRDFTYEVAGNADPFAEAITEVLANRQPSVSWTTVAVIGGAMGLVFTAAFLIYRRAVARG